MRVKSSVYLKIPRMTASAGNPLRSAETDSLIRNLFGLGIDLSRRGLFVNPCSPIVYTWPGFFKPTPPLLIL